MCAFSTHSEKREDYIKMGADRFISFSEDHNLWVKELHNQVDLISIATNSFTGLDWEQLSHVMKMAGKIVSAAEPPFTEKLSIRSFALVGVSVVGVSVGNSKEIDIMMNVVAENDLNSFISKEKMDATEARYKMALIDFDKQFGN